MNGVTVDKTKEWARPCFKGFSAVVIGDSSVRAFGRVRREMRGMSISSFGGMDVIELINILQSGKLSKEWDMNKLQIRNRFQNGRDEFPTIRFCTHCYSECLEEFTGDLVLVIGLNNVLRANSPPYATETGLNLQDFDAMFKVLDNTCKKMAPNAKVKLAPMLAINKYTDGMTNCEREAWTRIQGNIKRRMHLEMDNDEPRRKGLYDRYGVHLRNWDGVDYWTKVLIKNLKLDK